MSTPEEVVAITNLLHKFSSPTIVELGAYCGEDSRWMREACMNKHAINVMVEPDHRNCALIRSGDRGVRTALVQAAIADYSGTIGFHFGMDERLGGRSGSGSIRVPTKHKETFPEITFAEPQPVTCWALDHLMFSLGIKQVEMLWVDIQGAERDMIAGGQLTLAATHYLFIESEQVEFYEGQALRAELLGLLPNFKVIATFEYNLLLEAC